MGPKEPAPRTLESLQRSHSPRRKHSRLSAFQLDRDGCLAVHPRGKHPRGRSLFRKRAPNVRTWRGTVAGRARLRCVARRAGADGQVASAFARLQSLHRSDPFRCRQHPGDHCRIDLISLLGAGQPRYRPRSGRLDGTQEAGGLFLVATAAFVQDAAFSIDDFLAEERSKDLLRFSTAGSVDDGKSTLIGRLLYDTQSVYEDQMQSIEGKGTTAPGQIDFALLTDGLRAEREQGITIDVAYRYFSTSRRKFIIADTPGHEQYTRNMATGASTADAAVVLIDARKGVLAQSRRHAYIASLLGVRQILVAINKMDLVDFDEHTFGAIKRDFHDLLRQISADTGNPVKAVFVPVSALLGDNVAHRSDAMPWYRGPSLLELLESVSSSVDSNSAPFRFAVQRVLRPDHTFRGFAGQISSGTIRPGDRLTALPSGRTAN